MEKNNRILKSFLTALALLVWLNVFRVAYINLRPPYPKQITALEPKIVTTVELKDISIKRRPKFVYPIKGLIDPFRKNRGRGKIIKKKPLLTKSEKLKSSLTLTAVIWNETFPMAILQEGANSHIVKIGEIVAGRKVIDIKKDSVTISKKDKKIVLRL